MNRYFPIDCAKMVLALLIVMMHCQVGFGNAMLDRIVVGDGYASGLEDLAVPLFFIFSGFFYAMTGNWRKTSGHLLRILLIWGIVSLPLSFHNFIGKSPVEAVQIILFAGTLSPIWFITTLIWCTLIVTAVARLRWRSTALALLLAVSFLLQAICFDIFHPGAWPLPESTRQLQTAITTAVYPFEWAFPRGLFLFTIGYCIRLFDIRLSRPAAWLSALILLAAYLFGDLLPLSESAFRLLQMLVYPAVTVAIMLLLLACSRPVDRSAEGRLLREASTLLYLSHMIIRFFIYRATGEEFGWICFTAVIVAFALGFALFVRLRRRQHFTWLRYAC